MIENLLQQIKGEQTPKSHGNGYGRRIYRRKQYPVAFWGVVLLLFVSSFIFWKAMNKDIDYRDDSPSPPPVFRGYHSQDVRDTPEQAVEQTDTFKLSRVFSSIFESFSGSRTGAATPSSPQYASAYAPAPDPGSWEEEAVLPDPPALEIQTDVIRRFLQAREAAKTESQAPAAFPKVAELTPRNPSLSDNNYSYQYDESYPTNNTAYWNNYNSQPLQTPSSVAQQYLMVQAENKIRGLYDDVSKSERILNLLRDSGRPDPRIAHLEKKIDRLNARIMKAKRRANTVSNSMRNQYNPNYYSGNRGGYNNSQQGYYGNSNQGRYNSNYYNSNPYRDPRSSQQGRNPASSSQLRNNRNPRTPSANSRSGSWSRRNNSHITGQSGSQGYGGSNNSGNYNRYSGKTSSRRGSSNSSSGSSRYKRKSSSSGKRYTGVRRKG